MRYGVYLGFLALTLLFVVLAVTMSNYWWTPAIVTGALGALGTRDFFQARHTLLRNYPLVAHFRWLFEAIRPEIRQYLIESDTDGAPFPRNQRSLVYRRAKGVNDKFPFGTEQDVYRDSFEWLNPSQAPRRPADPDFRIEIGGHDCRAPYSSSVLNVSAMSFGSLSAAAVRALNKAAAHGGFAQDTGEGGISPYHRESGGDLIWEIGSGYFGCRTRDGHFCPHRFSEQAADEQVKMVELKLSQGAKPGHGGVLPGCKVTPEIAEARGVEPWQDVISPGAHSAFSNPVELMEFIARLRELCGGKPVGFKLCIGHGWEFMAICKAMRETGIRPDFIVIDGAEGGTGAAPLELMNAVGTPLREGLVFAQNALVGAGLRNDLTIGVAGKVTSSFHIARNLALGADWCNAARAFMFSIGCVQSQSCHTDRCPTGVTTQNPWRQRGLVVPEKAERARQYHRDTLAALSEFVAAAGVGHPGELAPSHFSRRISSTVVKTLDQVYPWLEPEELLSGCRETAYRNPWDRARADSWEAATLRP